jgi:hypothetical protein
VTNHSEQANDAKANDAERQMRDSEALKPKTTSELAAYIDGLIDREHDYGTCVYAMSLAATAAFNLVAHKLGVTGFQASCADLDILRRTRRMDGPFVILDGEKGLYPQYDLVRQVEEWLIDIRPWLAEQAKARLAENSKLVHPDVERHWRELTAFAARKPAESEVRT